MPTSLLPAAPLRIRTERIRSAQTGTARSFAAGVVLAAWVVVPGAVFAQASEPDCDEAFLRAESARATPPSGKKKGELARELADLSRRCLARGDAVVAVALADAAVGLDGKSVEARVAQAEAAVVLGQRGIAVEALDAALAMRPRDGDLLLRAAFLAEEEGRLAQARTFLRRVPSTSERAAEAEIALRRVDAALAVEKAAATGGAPPTPSGQKKSGRKGAPPAPPPAEEAVEEVAEGFAARESRHFRIVYASGTRDFGQRARYEDKVLELFERAYDRVGALLGQRPGGRTDVVLYTSEEFELHFGGAFAGGILGFYAGKIRMNHAEKLDDRFYATAVHEYVHAWVDQVSSGRGHDVPIWLNEGLARWVEREVTGGSYIGFHERNELRAAQRAGALPPLAILATTPFGSLGPQVGIAYSKSSAAIEVLRQSGGLARVVRIIERVGGGTGFEPAFAGEFGSTRLDGLDGEIVRLIER